MSTSKKYIYREIGFLPKVFLGALGTYGLARKFVGLDTKNNKTFFIELENKRKNLQSELYRLQTSLKVDRNPITYREKINKIQTIKRDLANIIDVRTRFLNNRSNR